MAQEFEYTVQVRTRRNQVDTATNACPLDPKWGPWTAWGTVRTFESLAGAAMSANGRNTIHRTYGNKPEERVPYAQTEARVAYRLVPATWIPLLPELEVTYTNPEAPEPVTAKYRITRIEE